MMKNPTLGPGVRVYLEAEQQEGTIIKTEHCGRITVQLDCGLIDYYEAAELIRVHIKELKHDRCKE